MVTLFSAAHSQIGTSKAETSFFLMEKIKEIKEVASKECTVRGV